MHGKKWTVQEEVELKALVEADASVEEIAAKFQKTAGAIIVKCQRLGLQLETKGSLNPQFPFQGSCPVLKSR